VVQTLLAQRPDERDPGLAELAREAVLSAIVGEAVVTENAGVRGAAVALRASLEETRVVSRGERLLLEELLARIAEDRP
jgi:hypothetical protein